MGFLSLANHPELTRRLAAARRLCLSKIVRKPSTPSLCISPPHRLSGIRSHWRATTHFLGPGVDTQNRRNFVLCFDGTGDQFDAENTNVVQFCSALKKDDASQQMVYYQPGVGTYTIPQTVTRVRAGFQKYINMAIANHLSAHVMSGYEFLMQNCRPV